MKALVVTNKHGMYCEEVEVQSAAKSQHYVDDLGRLYHINDIVDIETVDHELEKAIKLMNYWEGVIVAINNYKRP